MPTIPLSKSPSLTEYIQTSKTVSGAPYSYTTKNDAGEGALRVGVVVVTPIYGEVKQRREAKFNILNELLRYNPTRVTISEIYVESKWSGSGNVGSDVDVFLKDVYGTVVYEFKDVASAFERYSENRAAPNLDVTGQQQFSIEVYQDAWAAPGTNEIRTRNMRVTFVFETAVDVYPVIVRIIDEQGNFFPDSHAKVDTISWDFPSGQDTIQLPTGDYTIDAWGYIGGTKYTGKKAFNVPADPEVTVTLKPPSLLPWWWWIPVVTVGGLAAMAVVIPALKRPPRPSVYVVRK